MKCSSTGFPESCLTGVRNFIQPLHVRLILQVDPRRALSRRSQASVLPVQVPSPPFRPEPLCEGEQAWMVTLAVGAAALPCVPRQRSCQSLEQLVEAAACRIYSKTFVLCPPPVRQVSPRVHRPASHISCACEAQRRQRDRRPALGPTLRTDH